MNEEIKNIVKNKSTPPNIFARNDYGLFDGVDYIYDENGFIDYRKMLKDEHIVPNEDKSGGEKDISKLEDSQLIILLSGIKYLAWLRGYTSVEYTNISSTSDYVVMSCKIKWIGNYETEGKVVEFSSVGDASPNNTKGFASLFLGPIAENRAFSRAVRNFLKINIVSKEELQQGSNPQEEEPAAQKRDSSPTGALIRAMSSINITFDKLKEKMIKENDSTASSWTKIEDIPAAKAFEIIGRIKKKISEESSKK